MAKLTRVGLRGQKLTQADLRAQRKIYALDLRAVVKCTRKLEKWTAKQASDAELWYKNFLWMSYLNGRRPVAVLRPDADKVWHNHILDTSNYHKDCKAIFGGYLHHQSITGRPTRVHLAAIAATQQSSMELFNVQMSPYSVFSCSGCAVGTGSY
jgi:hypothetical protein